MRAKALAREGITCGAFWTVSGRASQAIVCGWDASSACGVVEDQAVVTFWAGTVVRTILGADKSSGIPEVETEVILAAASSRVAVFARVA